MKNLNTLQEVIRLETQYWALVEIPRQEKQETVPAFVLRACTIMEKTHKSGEGVKTAAKIAEEEEKRKERLSRLEGTQKLSKLKNARRVPCIIKKHFLSYFTYFHRHITSYYSSIG